MSSPASPSIVGMAKVTFAALLARSTSAEAVVPVRSIAVRLEPTIGNGTDAVPFAVSSRWTLLADSADVSAAITIAVGSVRTGALDVGLHAARISVKTTVAAMATIGAGRRIMRVGSPSRG